MQSNGQCLFVDQTNFESCLQYPDAARSEGIKTILSMPLSIRDTVTGCLRIYSADERTYDNKEMALITKFSRQAALAIENAIIYETMRKDIEGMKNTFREIRFSALEVYGLRLFNRGLLHSFINLSVSIFITESGVITNE